MENGPTLGVGMVGHAFMGRVHSQAWRNVSAFFDLPVRPVMAALSGLSRERAAAAADSLGWATSESDWRELLKRDDIHIIDICTPGDTHAEIAIAALEAGKHVLCEKPLANSVAEAEAMAEAARDAAPLGIRNMAAFNYRRVPAVAYARSLVAAGRLGEIRHIRAQYLQDWIVDPEHPLVWRLRKDKAGSGALGDIGAHIIDTAQFVSGQSITGVSGLSTTFIPVRPLPDGSGHGEVTVDDAALFLARLDGGAIASFEATRFATGRKNSLRLEINGSLGSLAFDFEAMNELEFHDHTLPGAESGFRRVLVTEADHPYAGAWWPPGHGLGYEHTFTHQIRDFLAAISENRDPAPSFTDGLHVQRVIDAVERSAATESRWTPVAA
ncbi:Gfo/Idh/MocA family oxidoreductase [Actinocorallia sp. A-T 12471]|uniref:Gfo/Idh/MocA family protein n=1 Tax=Actinocorallia sp. A-T 12471 TaxID=3089813 RepID=UPI0029CD278F|nr:Gfo/Idh/MocA family oxidoreductase [Actinocorallia sp. A-T 12471]MDX6740607.1 Gfo/Idh/MocA family oxidoreductase [Actinocorallia sp. A-T 12471]